MTVTGLLWLIIASFGTGAVNAVAGGGTLISFPALVALGLSPVAANATNTIALVPGSLASAWAYRHDLRTHRHLMRRFLLPSIVGGLLGATLVLSAPERVFELVVPWLVLGATLLILMKNRLWQRLKAKPSEGHSKGIGASIAILLMAIYGGYFGAGIGIITLAVLSLTADLHIHEMNGIKTLIASTVNGTAAVFFLARGTADVKTAAIMSIGMILGGYFGAKVARKTPAKLVERLVVGIGFAMTLVLAARWFK
ncbi:MAG: sulfite exporter TauE/SafE family protein [Polyangiaceae bacterium]